jgi:5-enolpyruvylshikimate-3-phosphate synthase
MRSLTAVLGMGKKSDLVLDGVPRMRERPIADLTNALSEV